jgi:acetyl-CoA decarbonylase/synthase complex subunit alpha
VGHTPMPDLPDLRNWDMRLLKTYPPWYAPFCDVCCFCTYGKCDLTAGRRGGCGMDIAGQQGRIVLQACCTGLSAHGAHARHIIDHMIEKYGEDFKIDLGANVPVEAPNIRLVLGLKPETLKDLETAVEYVERELIHLVSSLHTGQEGSNLDFESKALHAGMLDHVVMEAADIAQIIGFKYPTSVAETPLVDLGCAVLDGDKPTIIVVGHNPVSSTAIVDYLREKNLRDKVEIGGLCCTAHETTRYDDHARIIGPLSRQLYYVRTGIADVIVTDEQCIRTDLLDEARKVGTGFMATSDKACYGLEDATEKDVDEIVQEMVKDGKQFLILDPQKAAEVAVRVAMALAPTRKSHLIDDKEARKLAKKCVRCDTCERACPNMLDISVAMSQVGKGNLDALRELFDKCLGCGKCEEECPHNVPIFKIMQTAARKEAFKVRTGRGPIMDTEIRNVGAPIVLGTIPGVLAIVGCSNYPNMNDVVEIAEEFAKRKYIVVLSGCAAMAAGMKKDADGKTIYEKYPRTFEAG